IHPSIFYTCLSYYWVTGNLEPIPIDYGHKAGYTLDRVPVYRRAQSHTHTSHTLACYRQFRDAIQCMSLDWGRKPEYPEETPEAQEEHANSTHTHSGGDLQMP
ncbi:hypothetical protein QTP86_014285, partial [Hemibagrus guttatus]